MKVQHSLDFFHFFAIVFKNSNMINFKKFNSHC